MSDQRRKILELLAQGKISAEKAAEKLSQIKLGKPAPTQTKQAESEPTPPAEPKSEPSGQRLTIEVTPIGGKKKNPKPTFAISIPLKLLKFGAQIGDRFAPHLHNVDWDNFEPITFKNKTEKISLFLE